MSTVRTAFFLMVFALAVCTNAIANGAMNYTGERECGTDSSCLNGLVFSPHYS